ncbi:hypothetical protein H0I76_07345 [Limibaculum sp. M0105]|uniref:OmpR/PhoB-type domain-containing protein n=1 Tax=Thermohalobaculum xanthum TaxID=2753746 RepID=A0A8J7M622_9RHOB|nr:hypothetical protein [Thermohalobaculum xanthum]MBK0398999.1 hypothetical protein [Thermohalobaculum xanthum]
MRKRSAPSPIWRLMGDLSIVTPDGVAVDGLGTKALALLAYLALTAERVSRAELAGMLWPGPDPSRSKHNLRQCLLSLRKSLGDSFEKIIKLSDQWVALDHDVVRIDALEILRIDSGRRASAAEIIGLCRGPFLRALATRAQPFDDWLELQRERLDIATQRIATAAYESARRSGQTSQAANLRTILETISIAETASEQTGNWGLLTRKFSGRRARPLRRLGIGAGAIILVVLASIGAYHMSMDVRHVFDDSILGERKVVRRIAVLPFTTSNATTEEQSLAGGVTLGVNYALYAITARELFVVTHVAQARDLGTEERLAVAKDLGVQYLISGTVEVKEGVVRVFAQCLDAQTRTVIWREQFDRPIAQAFSLQDEITLEILKGLDIELNTAEWNRIQYLDDTENLHAWLAAANGVRHLIRVRKEDVEIARASYVRALQYDPEYISARRGLAWVSFLRVRLGWSRDPAAEILEAKNQLGIVLRKRPDDGLTKSLEGAILLLEERYEDAVDAGEFAVEMLPGSADATAVLAHTLTYVGETARALELINRAMELSPMSPGWYRWTKGRVLRLAGRFDEAIELLEQDLGASEPTLVHLAELTASYSANGNKRAAQRVARVIRRIDPEFSASAWLLHPRLKDPELQSKEFEYLSGAGL